MVTKQVTINGTKYHCCNGEPSRMVYEYYGYEAEATAEYAEANGVINGECFCTIDTKAVLQWDAEAKTWNKW